MPTLSRHAVGAPFAMVSVLLVHMVLCVACRPQTGPSPVDSAVGGPPSHSAEQVGGEALGATSKPSTPGNTDGKPTDPQPSSDEPDRHGQSDSAAKDQSKHQNRLANETSPYLLMHAHNPVDWYPWGEEAMEKAKRESKVIFLSIGYSSCHWCHVMERESFMDQEIADFLNQHFVCIKLDREERPDVDAIYMRAVQLLTRASGGWPLSVFLMPDTKPFFGGTYFPPRDGDRSGHTGFLTVIKRVHAVWNDQRQELEKSANQLAEYLATELRGQPAATPIALDAKLLQRVLEALAGQYDDEYGGFGYDPSDPARPKFPEPSNLLFLINRIQQQDDPQARRMLVGTLQRMAMGGIQDHIGGGFHRYSVDRYWHIPHFEKMLYDNGQLATVYAEAYLLTGAEDYRLVLSEMADFVLRELVAPEGAFYSALDADSEGEEGKFYRWEKEEFIAILSPSELAQIAPVYGLDGPPNFEDRYYVPLLREPLAQIATTKQLSEQTLITNLAPLRQKLLAARNTRTRPLTDWKILTSWNGLMIRGLADTGRALKEPRYIDAATRAADFVLENLRTEQGRLLRTYSKGQAKLGAYVDDYAFLVDGLVALHRATGDDRWLRAADELTGKQIELFWDERDGGFFFTAVDHESLIVRGKVVTDGALPAGNSVTAANLLYLARTLPKPEYVSNAERTIQAASLWLEQSPAAAPRLMIAVAELLAQRDNVPTKDEVIHRE